MRLLQLQTSKLALLFSTVTLLCHLGTVYLLAFVTKHEPLTRLGLGSLKVYWPALDVVQLFGTNGGGLTMLLMLLLAALIEWWLFFTAAITLARLLFRKPPVSQAVKFALLVFVLAFAFAFYKATPETLGMTKYQRFRADISSGETERVRQTLKTNPDYANKVQPGWGTALHAAAQSGHPDIAELLLKSGADVNATDGEGETPLHTAVKWSGHYDVAKLLIAYHANVNARNRDELTPLWRAAAQGDTNLILLLLENGADVNARGKSANCPLSGAIGNNRYGVVPLLLARGANAYLPGPNGSSMLDEAVIRGSPELAQMLLPYFSKTNAIPYLQGAFLRSLQDGDLNLAHPIAIHALRFESNSIHAAAYSGDFEGVQAHLASEPAPLDSKDLLELTPMHWAALGGQSAVLNLLLSKGAPPNATDAKGNTPLHWAVFTGQSNIVTSLIQSGATVNAKGSGNKTPLHLAVQRRFLPIANTLLVAGANPNAASAEGNTPLYLAVASSDSAALRMLQSFAADFKVPGHDESLFHAWAEANASSEIADLLLANGCDVNSKGRQGRTPLHALVANLSMNQQVTNSVGVQWLLEHAANINAKNDQGQTPLSLLKWRIRGRTIERRKDIADMLRSHGAKE